MNENQISRTALFTAYFRGFHARNDAPRIFDDTLAWQLLAQEERAGIEQNLPDLLNLIDPERAATCPDKATALAQLIRFHLAAPILSRSRYTEDILEEAVKQGTRQYVILGAGMDTFAFRQKEANMLQVFEIDHPVMQAFKRKRLDELGWKQPARLHFVPVDFTKESSAEVLKRSAYDPLALSFFSWLGVTYYLPRDAVFETLRAMAGIAPKGSTVVFDYYDTDAFDPKKSSKRLQVGMEQLKRIGEPLITGFDPSSLASDLAHLGLSLQDNLSPADIDERYFKGRTDGYHAYEHVHFARAVVE